MISCPICKNKSVLLRKLTKEYISHALSKYYRSDIPDIDLVDYEMYCCDSCTLEFFNPMFPGTDRFYEWIIHQPNYYPTFRWEWKTVVEELKRKNGQIYNPRILEAGCGNGDFLNYINRNTELTHVGIDTSPSAIKVCKEAGLTGFCGTINDFANLNPSEEGRFDYAVSFHCLEHVPDPLSFVSQMKKMLKSDGRLFISTPYSPMTFESYWYDPLNHPPHHTTRWNIKSYKQLADSLDMKIRFYSEDAGSVFKRAMIALFFKKGGISFNYSKRRVINTIINSPLLSIKEYFNQQKREKVNGRTVGNTILVEMFS